MEVTTTISLSSDFANLMMECNLGHNTIKIDEPIFSVNYFKYRIDKKGTVVRDIDPNINYVPKNGVICDAFNCITHDDSNKPIKIILHEDFINNCALLLIRDADHALITHNNMLHRNMDKKKYNYHIVYNPFVNDIEFGTNNPIKPIIKQDTFKPFGICVDNYVFMFDGMNNMYQAKQFMSKYVKVNATQHSPKDNMAFIERYPNMSIPSTDYAIPIIIPIAD